MGKPLGEDLLELIETSNNDCRLPQTSLIPIKTFLFLLEKVVLHSQAKSLPPLTLRQ